VPQHINQTEFVSLGATKTDPQLHATGPHTQHDNTDIIKTDML